MKAISIKGFVAGCFSLWLVVSLFFPDMMESKVVQAQSDENKVVLGYYSSWNPPSNVGVDQLTHINYAFADVCWDGIHGNPDNEEIPDGEKKTWACKDLQGNEDKEIENGTIVLYDPEVDLVELPKLEALKSQNSDLKTLISVGGWTLSNNLSLVASSEETRQVFAESAVDFVRTFHLDGLDLDWEYPVAGGMPNNHRDPSDKQNHTLLLQAVRDAFDQAEQEDEKEYLLTIAGAATWAYAENNELGKIAEIVDYMAIMAYDINGTWSGLTGHNAPLYGDPLETELRGWTFGVASTIEVYGDVPRDKLLLGVPFYGHSWAGCNPDQDGKMAMENGAYQECAPGWEQQGIEGGTVNYHVIKSLINQDGYNYFFDNTSKVPYLYNEKQGEFISYDNVESLGYKVNFIKEQGLKGAMIWDLAGDDQDKNLLKTVSYGLGVSAEAPTPDPEPVVELHLEDDPAPVSANSLIKILADGQETGVELQLPADLPAGTTLQVTEPVEGLEQLTDLAAAGPVYTFHFTYPDGESFTSEEGFSLTMPVEEEAESPAIYYFNVKNNSWEQVDSEVNDGKIIITVEQFSTYGVFVATGENEEDPEEEIPGDGEKEDTDPGNGDGEKEDTDPGNGDGEKEDTDPGNGDGEKEDTDPGNGDGEKEDTDPGNGDGEKEDTDPGNGDGEKEDTDPDNVKEENVDVSAGDGNKTNNNSGVNQDAESGNYLPNTATALFNYLLIGFIILLAGAGIFLYKRKKQVAKTR
ncbi:glycoside hydrolase family 18 protein [Gracilibacillus alcaliphilus]|uniref:glycoside hydrolase family 18 protein n=1 Tax=Gracilibacillus alcaliphilus TaxID=1401441 RepID=UPI001EF7F121|nr:glycoside hydrolase family 18 protein [Gracilibacillus alcaliphilus]MBM7676220.1 chitinase [Gracilibacillus alcaliphilus]